MRKNKSEIQENLAWAMSRKNPLFPLVPVLPFVAVGMLALNVFLNFRIYRKLHA